MPLPCQAGEKERPPPPPPPPRSTEPPCARVDRVGIDMCRYDSHEELVGRLRAVEAEHPGLAKTGIIGKTVEGRDLFYIKVRKPLMFTACHYTALCVCVPTGSSEEKLRLSHFSGA